MIKLSSSMFLIANEKAFLSQKKSKQSYGLVSREKSSVKKSRKTMAIMIMMGKQE